MTVILLAMDKQIERIVYKSVLAKELEIDSQGRIWRLSARRGRGHGRTICIPCVRRRAEVTRRYLEVGVMRKLRKYNALAHRLVFHHFYGPIPAGLTVNHINGDKLDNRPQNLELATRSEQRLHAVYVLGIRVLSGEEIGNSKLTWKQVSKMRSLHRVGWSFGRLSREFGVCLQTASDVCNRRTWAAEVVK